MKEQTNPNIPIKHFHPSDTKITFPGRAFGSIFNTNIILQYIPAQDTLFDPKQIKPMLNHLFSTRKGCSSLLTISGFFVHPTVTYIAWEDPSNQNSSKKGKKGKKNDVSNLSNPTQKRVQFLQDALRDTTHPLTYTDGIIIIVGLLRALAQLDANHVIHGDLHPYSILLDEKRTAISWSWTGRPAGTWS